MPPMNPEQWPEILTNRDWQKKKGNIAKIAGKSGVGEAMTAAEKTFQKINWKLMDARDIPAPQRDLAKLRVFRANVGTQHKQVVEPARAALKKLRDTAAKTAAEWKKSKAIPASSTKHAELVAKTADELFVTLAGNSQFFGDKLKGFDAMIATKEKNARDELAKLDETVAQLEVALREVMKEPTIAKWSQGNTSAHQRCRSMCNAIRNIPALKAKYWSTWQPYGDEYHRDCPSGERETAVMKQKITTVGRSLMEFKADYRRTLAAAA